MNVFIVFFYKPGLMSSLSRREIVNVQSVYVCHLNFSAPNLFSYDLFFFIL